MHLLLRSPNNDFFQLSSICLPHQHINLVSTKKYINKNTFFSIICMLPIWEHALKLWNIRCLWIQIISISFLVVEILFWVWGGWSARRYDAHMCCTLWHDNLEMQCGKLETHACKVRNSNPPSVLARIRDEKQNMKTIKHITANAPHARTMVVVAGYKDRKRVYTYVLFRNM